MFPIFYRVKRQPPSNQVVVTNPCDFLFRINNCHPKPFKRKRRPFLKAHVTVAERGSYERCFRGALFYQPTLIIVFEMCVWSVYPMTDWFDPRDEGYYVYLPISMNTIKINGIHGSVNIHGCVMGCYGYGFGCFVIPTISCHLQIQPKRLAVPSEIPGPNHPGMVPKAL